MQNLLPHFFDPGDTEAFIASLYNITPEQVSAVRAYVFENLEVVLREHLNIESRNAAATNPPSFHEAMERAKGELAAFKEWLNADKKEREQSEADVAARRAAGEEVETFREWFMSQQMKSMTGP
ncbi:MAG: hypothetical protein K2X38_08635 [Gemmataceae bacterium]|nr:hypothetical protein [Gemmataceae bacterium]